MCRCIELIAFNTSARRTCQSCSALERFALLWSRTAHHSPAEGTVRSPPPPLSEAGDDEAHMENESMNADRSVTKNRYACLPARTWTDPPWYKNDHALLISGPFSPILNFTCFLFVSVVTQRSNFVLKIDQIEFLFGVVYLNSSSL